MGVRIASTMTTFFIVSPSGNFDKILLPNFTIHPVYLPISDGSRVSFAKHFHRMDHPMCAEHFEIKGAFASSRKSDLLFNPAQPDNFTHLVVSSCYEHNSMNLFRAVIKPDAA